MINSEELDAMKIIDIEKIDKNKLTDITLFQIDKNLPFNERAKRYLEQIKNPYCFLCGDTPVKIEFSSSSAPLEDKILNYFVNLKNR